MNPQARSPPLPATPPDVALPMASSAGSAAHLLPERVRLLAEQSAGAAGVDGGGQLSQHIIGHHSFRQTKEISTVRLRQSHVTSRANSSASCLRSQSGVNHLIWRWIQLNSCSTYVSREYVCIHVLLQTSFVS